MRDLSKPFVSDLKIIPYRRNQWIAALIILLQLIQLFLLPLLLQQSLAWALLLIPMLVMSNTLWSLLHEVIHKIFHSDSKTNERWGRALGLVFGVSYDVVKFGHLMHHRYNREWESEWYNPAEKSYFHAALSHYGKLLGGVYYIGMVATLIFLLPVRILKVLLHRRVNGELAHLNKLGTIAENYFIARERYKKVRWDALGMLMLYGLSFALYGAFWPFFILMIAGRAFTISFMDNIYHYATPYNNSVEARELKLPKWAAVLVLNANHHYSHHRHADIPWTKLPELKERLGGAQSVSFWEAAKAQWRGPISIQAPIQS